MKVRRRGKADQRTSWSCRTTAAAAADVQRQQQQQRVTATESEEGSLLLACEHCLSECAVLCTSVWMCVCVCV